MQAIRSIISFSNIILSPTALPPLLTVPSWTRFCEVVKRSLCRLDKVPRNKGRAFPRSLVAAFYAALPLEDGPAVEIILREFRENPREIDLAVAR